MGNAQKNKRHAAHCHGRCTARHIFIAGLFAMALSACSTTKSIRFYCQDQQVDLYINGEYAGNGIVNFTYPKGTEKVEVSCMQDGLEIYTRTFHIDGCDGQTFELQIPKDYHY